MKRKILSVAVLLGLGIIGSNNISAQISKDSTLTKTSEIDEVVIIGYGDSKKKKLTTSISQVKTSEISSRNVSTANQLLQGQAAGVNLTSANGTPGSKQRVSIRGISSINGDNEPLYVIDGVILSKASASYNYSGEFIQDPLSMINPSDIESLDVLKDAAATSIYGSRGANGVIIINTKKGKSGKLKFAFNQISGFGSMPKKIKLLNGQQFIEMQNEAVNNYNNYSSPRKWDSKFSWKKPIKFTICHREENSIRSLSSRLS